MSTTLTPKRKKAGTRAKGPGWTPSPTRHRDRALEVLARDFTRTGRVLSGHYGLRCIVDGSPTPPAPAWSDSDHIWLSREQATPLESDADYGAMMGLSYHELAHVMYTPTTREMQDRCHGLGCEMAAELAKPGSMNTNYGVAWNILEDARIESLLLVKYPYLRDYLVLTFMEFIWNHALEQGRIAAEQAAAQAQIVAASQTVPGTGLDPLAQQPVKDPLGDMFFFTRGRRYLPRKLRIRARRRFRAKQHTETIAKLVDEYRCLNMMFMRDLKRAHILVSKLRDILDEINPPQKHDHVCSGTSLVMAKQQWHRDQDEREAEEEARRENQKEAGVLAAALKAEEAKEKPEQGEDDEPSTQASTPPAKKAPEPPDGSGGGQGQGQGSGGAGGGQGRGGQGDGEGDGDQQGNGQGGAGGKGNGTGSGGQGHRGKDDTDDGSQSDASMGQSVTDASAGSELVEADARAVKRVVLSAGHLDPRAPRIETEIKGVPDYVKALVPKVTRELRKVEQDADPHWRTHTSVGRLNIRRAMHAEPGQDDLHDEWAEGQMTGTDMEVVVLLDMSGSMSGIEEKLSHIAWVTQRSCDQLRITCAQLAYSSANPYAGEKFAHTVVYGPKQKAKPDSYPGIEADGGTDPATALVDAHRSLSLSHKRHRVLLILTDGDWSMGVPQWLSDEYSDGQFRNCHDIIDDLNNRGVMTALAHLSTTPTDIVKPHQCQTHRRIEDINEWPLFVRDQLVKVLRRHF